MLCEHLRTVAVGICGVRDEEPSLYAWKAVQVRPLHALLHGLTQHAHMRSS